MSEEYEYKQKTKVKFNNNELLINDIKNFKFFSDKFDEPLPNFLITDKKNKIQYIDIDITKLNISFPKNTLEILKRIEENKYFKSFEEIDKFYDLKVFNFINFKYYLTKVNNVSHYKFRERLIRKGEENNCHVLLCTENWTSKIVEDVEKLIKI